MKRKSQGAVLALVLLCAICLMLWIAATFAPNDKSACANLPLPTLLGCAVAQFENLAGGLIAAAGALFGGWLAWSAVRDQIQIARDQDLAAKTQAAEFQVQVAERELRRLRSANMVLARLLQRIQENPSAASPNAHRLVEMWRGQEFIITSQNVDTETFGTRGWEIASRLRALAQEIYVHFQRVSAEHQHRVAAERESAATDAVSSLSALILEIDLAISRQIVAVELARERATTG